MIEREAGNGTWDQASALLHMLTGASDAARETLTTDAALSGYGMSMLARMPGLVSRTRNRLEEIRGRDTALLVGDLWFYLAQAVSADSDLHMAIGWPGSMWDTERRHAWRSVLVEHTGDAERMTRVGMLSLGLMAAVLRAFGAAEAMEHALRAELVEQLAYRAEVPKEPGKDEL